MANRVLRDWTDSEKMENLSLGAEVFFTRLIMKADDYGSFHANPKLLKAALFPLKEYSLKQVDGWLTECVENKLIGKYDVDGKTYIRIINFGQRLQNMRNAFPGPQGDFTELTVSHRESPPETKRNETEEETKQNMNPVTSVPFVGDVLDSWNDWLKYKSERKQKMTESTVKKQIQFLGGRGDPEIIAIIDQSISKGWTGLFELKNGYKNGNRNGNEQSIRRSDAKIESGRDFGTFS